MKQLFHIANSTLKGLAALSLSFHISCGGGSSGGAGGAATGDLSAAEFEGASSIEAVGTSWVIKWNPLNADDVIYSIYQGATKDSIVYDVPFATTDDNTYTYVPKNFYANEVYCFAIKVANMSGDANESVVCSKVTQLAFTGVSDEISSTGDGGWELQWDAVNVPGIMYEIYKGERGFAEALNPDVDKPMGIETNSFFQIKKEDMFIPREEEVCFLVRYKHEDLVEDTNTKELCTPTAPPIDFEGVAEVTALTTLKQIEVRWKKAAQEDPALPEAEQVTGYIIYAKIDETLEILTTIDALPPGLTYDAGTQTYTYITSYPSGSPGDGIPVSVKAIDAFYREDTNNCSAIANLNSGNRSVTQNVADCKSI